MDQIIPLFSIASLHHGRYPSMKSQCLAGYPTLINCNLQDLSGIPSREDNRQKALVIPISTPPATVNRVSNAQSQPPLTGRPRLRPSQPPKVASPKDYPTPMGVPWKFITEMVHSNTSCMGFHFNKPNDSTCLKFHQEVVCTDLEKHGYIFR